MGVETYWKEACENVMGWCTYAMQYPPFLCGQDVDYDGDTATIKLYYRIRGVLQIMYTLRSRLADLEFIKSEITVLGIT